MIINFSGALLRFVNFQKTMSLDANTVGEALAAVAGRFPLAKAVIYDGDGKVRQVHQVFVNGQQLASTDMNRSLVSSDRVDLLTAIAGG
jgi:sulfur-carrier protein